MTLQVLDRDVAASKVMAGLITCAIQGVPRPSRFLPASKAPKDEDILCVLEQIDEELGS